MTSVRGCAGSSRASLYWASDGHMEELHTLRLDGSRFRDADEAWVPVITPDGPGVLLWANSD
ncbi:DUF6210 family protein [Streptomyces sp. NPDC014685]|uniref:DUF6210 family protein n=1 Tax=Streptomyces sp. NPDC014685 TaxID=3364881 RepID=UPI0036FDA371